MGSQERFIRDCGDVVPFLEEEVVTDTRVRVCDR